MYYPNHDSNPWVPPKLTFFSSLQMPSREPMILSSPITSYQMKMPAIFFALPCPLGRHSPTSTARSI